MYKSIKTNFTIEFYEKTCPENITPQIFCISAIFMDISLLFLYNKYVIRVSCWEVLFPTYQMKTGMMKKGVIVPRIVTYRARLICENSAAFVQNTSIKNLTLSLSLPTAITFVWISVVVVFVPFVVVVIFFVLVNYLIAPIPSIYDSLSDVPESRVCFASKNLTPCRMH